MFAYEGKAKQQQKKTGREALETSRIAEFERFCFRKIFPKIPDDVIHPGSRRDDEDTLGLMTNLARKLILMNSEEQKLQ